ncbi:MAG: hypothetical protein CM1200mP32_12600 [Methanobacteriota archaeon]|nr:MAG: hypothetical protein CM1200mP32_12600 [Euryarchaeota archaeon]
MGNAEKLGFDPAVSWLGSQNWSNGKVAMFGKSYDGSTPWQAAMFGNDYLATIVPIWSHRPDGADVEEGSKRPGPVHAQRGLRQLGPRRDTQDIGNACPTTH